MLILGLYLPPWRPFAGLTSRLRLAPRSRSAPIPSSHSPSLADLGWNEGLQHSLRSLPAHDTRHRPGRVARVDRSLVVVLTAEGPEHLALGAAPTTADLAVGDWVVLDAGGGLDAVLPRHSALTRAAAGRATRAQVVAANLDRVFVVAVAAHANPRRIERALALAWA
ncbi:MAG: hypothetical protein ACRD0J_13030, partial [Acidimicrobiales bacterium]